MAANDGEAKDWIEGYGQDGKSIERIATVALVYQMQAELKKADQTLNQKVQEEQSEMMRIQNELNTCNEELVQINGQLSELRSQQSVSLSGDDKREVNQITESTISEFLERRPEEQEAERHVAVHFFPGREGGNGLQVGGEGAGSRDAKFKVKLNQTVQGLSTQAAKYWGLDPLKVFFLDRNGRVVPDNMHLADIILPPLSDNQQGPTGSAPPGRDRANTAMTTASAVSGELAIKQKNEAWTVKGRDYTLTLVRAGTVLEKEDLNKPKGEEWQDFTFNPDELKKDLENTRRKRGDQDVDNAKAQMQDIPSLFMLIQTGRDKKEKKQRDTYCRIFESLIFFTLVIFFHAVLMSPEDKWTFNVRLIGESIKEELSVFREKESGNPQVTRMDHVYEYDAFLNWVNGPLKRTVNGPTLPARNLFIVSMNARTFAASKPPEDGTIYCGDDEVIAVLDPCAGNGTNGTNETNGTNASNRTGCPAVNVSNITTSTVAPTTAASPAATNTTCNSSNKSNCSNASVVTTVSTTTTVPCVNPAVRECPSTLVSRVRNIYGAAMESGDFPPRCRNKLETLSVWDFFSKWIVMPAGEAFSLVQGKYASYHGGVYSTINVSSSALYDQAMINLVPKGNNLETRAVTFTVFVYSPTMQGLFVFLITCEFSVAGTVSVTIQQIQLAAGQESSFELYAQLICVLLAMATFLMELRRILGIPKRLSFEEERDKFSSWTVVFLVLPFILLTSFALREVRKAMDVHKFIEKLSVSNQDSKAFDDLYSVTRLDYFWQMSNLFGLFTINIIYFRYFLTYFPQVYYLTCMVRKLVKPLLTALLFLLVAFFVFGIWFYAMFGSTEAEFHGPVITFLSVCHFAQGGLRNWDKLMVSFPILWRVLMVCTFVFVSLFLNNMALAIMISHKKEKEIRENYSYHFFWSGRGVKNVDSFDPSQVGWDFSGAGPNKEPVDVAQGRK